MDIFGNHKKGRGCFFRYNLGLANTQASVKLILPKGPLNITNTTPYFITSVEFSQKEKYNFIECFNDRVYTYGFGHDPKASMASIRLVAFLVDKGGKPSNAIGELSKKYSESRLSKSKSPAKLVIGNTSFLGFVVGMTSSTLNPEYNLQEFTILMAIVSAQP